MQITRLPWRCQKFENIERTNVALRIMPHVVKPRKANIAALVAPTITDNQPNLTVNSEDWKIPPNLRFPKKQIPNSSDPKKLTCR